MSRARLAAIVLALLVAGCQRSSETRQTRPMERPDSLPSPAGQTEPESPKPPIVVETPSRGALVASPLRVSGRARGSWYFEADFPVYLYNGQDKMIGTGIARAQGDWMTTEYVPFEVSIVFHTPEDSTGTLVLEKSNPSGEAAHAASVRIPVRFR